MAKALGAGRRKRGPNLRDAQKKVGIITDISDYEVDGARVLDEMSGISRIDLVGEELEHGVRRSASLAIPRTELVFYPIGSKVRITVTRLR